MVYERHRHRFELNNHYRDQLAEAGVVFSGTSPNGRLVEIIELRDHPFFVGSQFHPEFRSRPGRPHPLFRAFMVAATQDPRFGEQQGQHHRRRRGSHREHDPGLSPARNARPREFVTRNPPYGPPLHRQSTTIDGGPYR